MICEESKVVICRKRTIENDSPILTAHFVKARKGLLITGTIGVNDDSRILQKTATYPIYVHAKLWCNVVVKVIRAFSAINSVCWMVLMSTFRVVQTKLGENSRRMPWQRDVGGETETFDQTWCGSDAFICQF